MEGEQAKSSVPEAEEQAGTKIDAPTQCPETNKQVKLEETKAELEEQNNVETKEPADWFEPLEDDDEDDDKSFEFPAFNQRRALGVKDAEEESLAGESERSGSVAGSEKAFKKTYRPTAPRRKRSHPDEGWMDWPTLGEGWKRKEVVRQKGTRFGQKDIYYMSPHGERARSRVELSSMLNRDLTSFEFKSGTFHKNGNTQPLRIRKPRKKPRERSSSESSFVERGEGADTSDSHHRLTPNLSSKPVASNQTSSSTPSTIESQTRSTHVKDDKIKLPGPMSSKPLFFPSINGEFGSEDSTLVCSKCGISFTGTWYDKQRKRPCCPSCWASKTREHPLIRFRKWIPCGQCVGCHNKVDCGQCSNCKQERTPESRKRLCRKRKCICPIRKGPGGFVVPKPNNETMDDSEEFTDFQQPSLKNSDTENFSAHLDVDDDDDMSTDDDDDWHKRRKRRSCGECRACLYRKDCGTCDFCIDKPKFGGSNKKRQKCRLRQCQRQAMRHLLPSPWAPGDRDGSPLLGRPKPHYTYSRRRKRGPPSDDEDEDSNQQASWSTEAASGSRALYQQNHQSSMQLNNLVGEQNGVPDKGHHISSHYNIDLERISKWDIASKAPKHIEEEEYPTITQIYSLADNQSESDISSDNKLMKLLTSLRSSVLPILWYAIMVDGPQLQVMQCSKQSNMTDTVVQIDPNFYYNVTVQKHPLLPTHPLYDGHPPQLSTIAEVVNLLLDLDKYAVCQGLPPTESVISRDPIILERAPTCEFLIKKSQNICTNCRMLCE